MFSITADQLLAPKYILWMWHGLLTTLEISALTAVLATLLGFGVAAARASRQRAAWMPAAAYVSLFRNTPLLVQLLFWYFGLPALFPEGMMEWLNSVHTIGIAGLSLTWPSYEFLAALMGLVLYSTAYVSEEIRAGIGGVGPAQSQAGAALGLNRLQVLRYIVLPQAVRIATPPLLGQYMNILKNTSLTMAIGLAELSYTSRQVEAETFRTFQAFGVATFMYIGSIALIEAFGVWRLQRAQRLQPGALPQGGRR